MGFASIFKDDNNWNEKTIIGFMSFAVMVVVMVADVVYSVKGHTFWTLSKEDSNLQKLA